jgi:hypothetical protein
MLEHQRLIYYDCECIFTGNNQTFYNVSFTSTSITTVTINGANTFNNLTVAGRISAGIAHYPCPPTKPSTAP